MENSEESWKDVIWDEKGIPVCAASALARYWEGDCAGVESWLLNIARRLWLPGCWDEKINRKALSGGFRGWMIALTEILTLATHSDDIDSQTNPLYENEVRSIASAISDFDSDIEEQRYIANDVTEDMEELAADAAYSMRYYCLAHLHSDEKSFRNPEFDWGDFYSYSSIVVKKTMPDTDPSYIDVRKRVQECIRVLRLASIGKSI